MENIMAFIDCEVGIEDKKIHDIGAVLSDSALFRLLLSDQPQPGASGPSSSQSSSDSPSAFSSFSLNSSSFHSPSLKDFAAFVRDAGFLCGHNIIHHDLFYLNQALAKQGIRLAGAAVDTLYLSPLLFPRRPYHALLKDDKLMVEQNSNPVNDCKKAQKLFHDEINEFLSLPAFLKILYALLLSGEEEFRGFFDFLEVQGLFSKPKTKSPYIRSYTVKTLIRRHFSGKLCSNADFDGLEKEFPVELAYALSLIWDDDEASVTPPWVLRQFPKIANVFHVLRSTSCGGCEYCRENLDARAALKKIFHYDSFRLYGGEPLQERAVQAAVEGRSLLAIFPTGGGKSLTFQLPALMAGRADRGLSVVISPLQSLMKDQVDNLNLRGITSAVTVNGMLDPIERADSLRRVSDGSAHLLYISPEQLRSRTIENLLLSRRVARFIIDEAHCFSAWGQDFRVDYLYIGDFIKKLQEKRGSKDIIPVSCFTATAKQKVISDICDYFRKKLGLELEQFATSAERENLRYAVLHCEDETEKYKALRNLLSQKDCPAIVYVSRTRRTWTLAERLTRDGFPSRPFNGRMESSEKILNQDAFMRNECRVIVATSAFGMGVDKKDVGLVVHYDISSSLEDYVQEAGRAGRDPSIQADCYILYNDNDLDKHFIFLNQTKLSISEIQQVWRAVKEMTRQRASICCSPLEIARQAGWTDSGSDVETRVRTALQALEKAGYLERGQNMPRVYATGIAARSTIEASTQIESSKLFKDEEKEAARRIISSLMGKSRRAEAQNDEAESRVDYLADTLGLTKEQVIRTVNLMRQAGILDDSQDMEAFLQATDTANKSRQILDRYARLERFLFDHITENGCEINLKELNEEARERRLRGAGLMAFRTLLYFLTIKNYIQKEENSKPDLIRIYPAENLDSLRSRLEQRHAICSFLVDELYRRASETTADENGRKLVDFSLVGLFRAFKKAPRLDIFPCEPLISDVADALLYLSKIGALKIEGGFLVLYNGMKIRRLVMENRIRYKVEDYHFLDEFYRQKIRMIHIVGEYCNLMVKDYSAALQYVSDYFRMDHRAFIDKYFKGEREKEIDRNITAGKYSQLFDGLSEVQGQIIEDKDSRYIVVAAGPGSGKTRVLVHKLASLLLLEDVKHDQLLMLTFSRAAATEFKKRLLNLVGNAANFVDIKTFHSYAFDLLGRIGNLEGADSIVGEAAEKIRKGEVEPGKLTKSVLVIDEAQDMSEEDFALVRALMTANEGMRIIAVGDDDQNIFAFRGSDSRYLRTLIDEYGAKKYEMTDNYRSCAAIVELSNAFVQGIQGRMKSAPGISVPDEAGKVVITHYRGGSLVSGLVQDVADHHRMEKACVLTQTNEEALKVFALLEKKGIRARLIESLGGDFRLKDLREISFFLTEIDRNCESAVIPEDAWENAKKRMSAYFAKSYCLTHCENMIRDFETVHPERYKTDLDQFLTESRYEDFYDDDQETLYVSTIHRAKGREFDAVYMLLQDGRNASDEKLRTLARDSEKGEARAFAGNASDEKLRTLYVGMTRAKTFLSIHCSTALFNKYSLPGIRHIDAPGTFTEPGELLLHLTHRDIFLDYFKARQDVIRTLCSGMRLDFDSSLQNNRGGFPKNGHNGFQNEWRKGLLYIPKKTGLVPVVSFSKSFREKLDKLALRGYVPDKAWIRFILIWRGKNDTEDIFIILPGIRLRKDGTGDGSSVQNRPLFHTACTQKRGS